MCAAHPRGFGKSRLSEIINFPQTPLVELNERRPGFSSEKNGFTRVNGKLVEHIQHRPRRRGDSTQAVEQPSHDGPFELRQSVSQSVISRASSSRASQRVPCTSSGFRLDVKRRRLLERCFRFWRFSDSENPNRTHPTSRFTKTGSASLFVGILGWGDRDRPRSDRLAQSN